MNSSPCSLNEPQDIVFPTESWTLSPIILWERRNKSQKVCKRHPWNQHQASMTQLNELPFTKPWIPCGHRISMGFKVETWWMSLRSRGWGYQWLTSDPRVQTCKKQVDIALLMLFSKDWREFQTFLISNPLRIRFVNLKSLEKFVAANKTQGSNFQQDLFAAKWLRQEPRQKGTCSLHLWLPNNAAVSNSPKADIHGILRRTRPQWKIEDFPGFLKSHRWKKSRTSGKGFFNSVCQNIGDVVFGCIWRISTIYQLHGDAGWLRRNEDGTFYFPVATCSKLAKSKSTRNGNTVLCFPRRAFQPEKYVQPYCQYGIAKRSCEGARGPTTAPISAALEYFKVSAHDLEAGLNLAEKFRCQQGIHMLIVPSQLLRCLIEGFHTVRRQLCSSQMQLAGVAICINHKIHLA